MCGRRWQATVAGYRGSKTLCNKLVMREALVIFVVKLGICVGVLPFFFLSL
jgi:hypothetical protein